MIAAAAAAPQLDLARLADDSLRAIRQERWADAHGMLQAATDAAGKKVALAKFGPQFGVIYYRKGLCELKLERWKDAASSFQSCYKDFANRGGNDNPFEKQALLKWGEAAMGAEDWATALRQFKKFTAERIPTRDDYARGAFYVNVAICNYKLGQIPAGNENLEIGIKNRTGFPTPNQGIVSGIETLVRAAIDAGSEQVLLDFLRKNRKELMPSYEMADYSRSFLKLAADTLAADMADAALLLCRLVPDRDQVILDLKKELAVAGDAALAKKLEAVEPLTPDAIGNEVVRLRTIALIQEKRGDLEAAYEAYAEMERNYPSAGNREANLFGLIRMEGLMEKSPPESIRHCREFLGAFPGSEQAQAVRRTMVAGLFKGGDYAGCIETLAPVIGQQQDAEDREVYSHILGASYYYEGKYELAAPLLDEHVETFPQSRYSLSSRYFQAANAAGLGQWKKAGGLLDSFVSSYPDFSANPLLPFALYERAVVHHAEQEDEQALSMLARIGADFPESAVAAVATDLQGEILESPAHEGQQ